MAIATPVTPVDLEQTTTIQAPWPDGLVPGTVAPFVMRYGRDLLVAMQRAEAQERKADLREPA